jgi:hypothetical protein
MEVGAYARIIVTFEDVTEEIYLVAQERKREKGSATPLHGRTGKNCLIEKFN